MLKIKDNVDLEKHRDVSSGMCEAIEKSFIDGKY